jgi:hypothetical protein
VVAASNIAGGGRGRAPARATVELPSGTVTFVAVHTAPPLSGVDPLYAVDVRGELVASTDGPLVLASDVDADR